MVQERARPRLDHDLLAEALDVEAIERLDRRLRLAERIAEGAEIVLTQKLARAFLHRRDVERRPNMPDPIALQRRWRSSIQDAVAVVPATRRGPRVEGRR